MVFRLEIDNTSKTFRTVNIELFGKQLYSSYYQLNGTQWTYDFFGTFGFTYWKPVKEYDQPFTLFMRFRDEDFYDTIDNKFIKLPKIKYWSFGAYSKWGRAKCT